MNEEAVQPQCVVNVPHSDACTIGLSTRPSTPSICDRTTSPPHSVSDSRGSRVDSVKGQCGPGFAPTTISEEGTLTDHRA